MVEKWKYRQSYHSDEYRIETEGGELIAYVPTSNHGKIIIKAHNSDIATQAQEIERLEAEVKDDIEIIHDATAEILVRDDHVNVLEAQRDELAEIADRAVSTLVRLGWDKEITKGWQSILNSIKKEKDDGNKN